MIGCLYNPVDRTSCDHSRTRTLFYSCDLSEMHRTNVNTGQWLCKIMHSHAISQITSKLYTSIIHGTNCIKMYNDLCTTTNIVIILQTDAF